MLTDTDWTVETLVKEETVIVDPPVGTFMWLQQDGGLYAALLYAHTLTTTKDLLLVQVKQRERVAVAAGTTAAAGVDGATGAGTQLCSFHD